MVAFNMPQKVQTAAARQVDIEQHDIREGLAKVPHGGGTVARVIDGTNIIQNFQHSAKPVCNKRRIFHDEYCFSDHNCRFVSSFYLQKLVLDGVQRQVGIGLQVHFSHDPGSVGAYRGYAQKYFLCDFGHGLSRRQ
jgi:hypothetical protein